MHFIKISAKVQGNGAKNDRITIGNSIIANGILRKYPKFQEVLEIQKKSVIIVWNLPEKKDFLFVRMNGTM